MRRLLDQLFDKKATSCRFFVLKLVSSVNVSLLLMRCAVTDAGHYHEKDEADDDASLFSLRESAPAFYVYGALGGICRAS